MVLPGCFPVVDYTNSALHSAIVSIMIPRAGMAIAMRLVRTAALARDFASLLGAVRHAMLPRISAAIASIRSRAHEARSAARMICMVRSVASSTEASRHTN